MVHVNENLCMNLRTNTQLSNELKQNGTSITLLSFNVCTSTHSLSKLQVWWLIVDVVPSTKFRGGDLISQFQFLEQVKNMANSVYYHSEFSEVPQSS